MNTVNQEVQKNNICWELKMFWLLYMNYLILTTTLWNKYTNYPHFKDKEMKAQNT